MFSSHTGRAAPARLLLALALAVVVANTAPTAAAAGAPPLHATTGAELRTLAARQAALPPARPIEDDDLQRRPALREVKLAPDGSKVAYLHAGDSTTGMHILDIASHQSRLLLQETPRDAMLAWSRDSRVLFAFSRDGISAIDAKDARTTRIANFDPALERQYIGIDPARPQHILADEYDRSTKLYRVISYAADGKQELLYEGRQLRGITFDAQGRLAFIKTFDKDYNQIISRREGKEWREIARCKPVRTCTPLSASPDGRKLYLIGLYDEDRRALLEIDAASGMRRLVHADRQGISDLRTVTLAPDSNQPLLASYDLPTRRNYALAPSTNRAIIDIDKRFGDANIVITPAAHGQPWLLAESGSQLQQERYWLYDPRQHSFERILADERPQPEFAAKQPVAWRASDGMLLHGYLTLPRGLAPGRLPIVTLVHGGPWSRVDSEFQWLPQWLANQGYAVFQPNFRASTGYGDRYMLAARMDFGNGRVQRDITDGVHWLLANGIGDRQRLAIVGDSFGGYATLLALTHTPDLFQFGLAAVPPPDFARTLCLAVDENKAGTEEFPTRVRFDEMGIRLTEEAAIATLAAGAPAANAGRLRKPLVMLAGARDQMVEIAAVTDYAARLQAAGRPVSLLVDPTEGHNPRKPILRRAYIHLLGRLLHDYLGGQSVAPPPADLRDYLEQNLRLNKAFRTIP